ncbi:MAG: SDR family oxidoreductase [Ignavibacteriae bacterium]|nr:SDR family oxidoreductase [Ignavibacteriota bacterium]
MRVLILGVTGMLGNAVFKVFTKDSRHEVWGTLRNERGRRFFAEADHARLISGIDVLDQDALVALMNDVRSEVVINCAGLIKQLAIASDPLIALPINAMFPHRLAGLCGLLGSRLIQLSSDCVYSGRKGGYQEVDPSDAEDLYGKSKFIGELHDYSHAITLRTSGIGHELNSNHGLLEWFLSQREQVKGYAKAIYSGLPSVEVARVIKDFVLPHPELSGLYHVSAKPIAKLDLLKMVANVYGKDIKIIPDDDLVIDRSLISERFTQATGYVAPEWPELIALMHSYR